MLFKELEGKLVRVQYLPTERSRKWRNASLVMHYTSYADESLQELQTQENWYKTKWVLFDVYD